MIALQVGGSLRRPPCWLLISPIVGQLPSATNGTGSRAAGRPARASPSARKFPPEPESLRRGMIGCPTRCKAAARTADWRSHAR